MLLEAFDVSSWQQDYLGSLSRYRLGIARASYGLGNSEVRYNTHISQMVAAKNLVPGAYHAGIDTSGASQADFFLATIAHSVGQPKVLMIDTREFGMTVAECNAMIARLRAVDPLKRPILIYDSEGNWQSGYVAHDGDCVANYFHMPSRPFLYWQDKSSGGPAGGDHGWVDPIALDKLLVGRTAPLWVVAPANNEVQLGPNKEIFRLDGRTHYSWNGPQATTFKAPGQAPGWWMIQDGPAFAAVLDRDLVHGS